MRLDDGESLAQGRRDAERKSLSLAGFKSPGGESFQGFAYSHFTAVLSVSAPLREILAEWIRLSPGRVLPQPPFEEGLREATWTSPPRSLRGQTQEVPLPSATISNRFPNGPVRRRVSGHADSEHDHDPAAGSAILLRILSGLR